MNYMKHNNHGLASVIFAMTFVVILSLLAVSFAFLVRNDQRQSLDTSLSYQATYAAETGVNKAIEEIRDKYETTGVVNDKTDCGTVDLGGEVNVTCYNWSVRSKEIIKSPLPAGESFITKLVPSERLNQLKLFWYYGDAKETVSPCYSSTSPAGKLPDINPNAVPILRVALIGWDGSSYNNSTFKVFYLVPNSNGNSANIRSIDTGSVLDSSCEKEEVVGESTDEGYKSELTFTIPPGYQSNSLISITALGQQVDNLTLTSPNKSDLEFLESQIRIESNAVAVDISKKVQAVIPYNPGTWSPSFSAAVGQMCKDIIIDGNNGTNASTGASPACPRYPTP